MFANERGIGKQNSFFDKAVHKLIVKLSASPFGTCSFGLQRFGSSMPRSPVFFAARSMSEKIKVSLLSQKVHFGFYQSHERPSGQCQTATINCR